MIFLPLLGLVAVCAVLFVIDRLTAPSKDVPVRVTRPEDYLPHHLHGRVRRPEDLHRRRRADAATPTSPVPPTAGDGSAGGVGIGAAERPVIPPPG